MTLDLSSNPRWALAMKIEQAEPGTANFRTGKTREMAHLLIDNCKDVSEESVTALLLGNARAAFAAPAALLLAESALGDRTATLLQALRQAPETRLALSFPGNTHREVRDYGRIYLCEAIVNLQHAFSHEGVAALPPHDKSNWHGVQQSLTDQYKDMLGKIEHESPNLSAILRQEIDTAETRLRSTPHNRAVVAFLR